MFEFDFYAYIIIWGIHLVRVFLGFFLFEILNPHSSCERFQTCFYALNWAYQFQLWALGIMVQFCWVSFHSSFACWTLSWVILILIWIWIWVDFFLLGSTLIHLHFVHGLHFAFAWVTSCCLFYLFLFLFPLPLSLFVSIYYGQPEISLFIYFSLNWIFLYIYKLINLFLIKP